MIKVNRKIITLSLWSVLSIVLVVLLGFSGKEQKVRRCNGLKIKIADETGNYFIEPKDIVELLNTKAGKVKQLEMKDVNLTLLEKIVYTNPYVAKAEVFSTIDGYVNINIWQRNPVLRVVNFENEHYYIDDQGGFMPVTDKFTGMVPVATGYIFDKSAQRNLNFAIPFISDTTQKPLLVQLNEIAHFIAANEFWDAQIEQIYVNERNEIELVPRVGSHTILIGNSENIESKMSNLLVFYNEGISKKGWDSYTLINLKFNNQVICTKSPNRKNI